jgi:hypothetical protein
VQQNKTLKNGYSAVDRIGTDRRAPDLVASIAYAAGCSPCMHTPPCLAPCPAAPIQQGLLSLRPAHVVRADRQVLAQCFMIVAKQFVFQTM